MNNLYYTQSLNLASYIMANGIEPVGKTKSNGSVTIYFDKTEQLHDIVKEYNKNDDLKKFISSFKKLKQYLNN